MHPANWLHKVGRVHEVAACRKALVKVLVRADSLRATIAWDRMAVSEEMGASSAALTRKSPESKRNGPRSSGCHDNEFFERSGF